MSCYGWVRDFVSSSCVLHAPKLAHLLIREGSATCGVKTHWWYVTRFTQAKCLSYSRLEVLTRLSYSSRTVAQCGHCGRTQWKTFLSCQVGSGLLVTLTNQNEDCGRQSQSKWIMIIHTKACQTVCNVYLFFNTEYHATLSNLTVKKIFWNNLHFNTWKHVEKHSQKKTLIRKRKSLKQHTLNK